MKINWPLFGSQPLLYNQIITRLYANKIASNSEDTAVGEHSIPNTKAALITSSLFCLQKMHFRI